LWLSRRWNRDGERGGRRQGDDAHEFSSLIFIGRGAR
jgi:hypothetical protein